MDEAPGQLARTVAVQRMGVRRPGVLPDRVHSLRIADQARVEHLQFDTNAVRGLVHGDAEAASGVIEENLDGCDEEVAPDRGMGIGAPGEQATAQHEFELFRVPVSADVGREEAAVEGPHRLVPEVLICPGAPLPLEPSERLADLR